MPAIYTIYVSFILGMSLKLLFSWAIEYSFINSVTESTNTNKFEQIDKQFLKRKEQIHAIDKWITRIIRRKESPPDDKEDHFLLHI
ncbi:hypothetical protein [Metabacillus fastidiosus]|uniref:Uncharacterized protein n=2 Tax=Metabacillus fastidiosus TaxID=1458 RepID=A0ABU6P136_9BACI|nr:hypothetical protein [Metabacillus fastidiosus]MED4403062.1 hypothetical protein [Metabacillus fastidiosus]